MKSSFLICFALSALVSVPALAQTNRRRAQPARVQTTPKRVAAPKKTVAPRTQTTTQAVSTTKAAEKSPFDRFYDRLSLGYFGVFTSPNLQRMNAANAALSPEFGDTGRECRKNCDTYAMNLWSQVNIAYDFGWIMKFVIIPRWTIHFANPSDMSRSVGEDRAMIGLEDALVGVAGVVLASEDKKFNWFIRPAMRLPTSHFSRTYNQTDNATTGKPGVGRITNQLEIAHFITYDPNPKWQYGLMLQQRLWVYEYRINPTRLRYYTSPYVSYAIRETTKIQLYYQNMIENNKRWESINGKKPVYKDVWQDVMLSVAQDVTPRMNVMPYVGLYVNDVPLSMQSAYIGAWISYKIK